MELAGRRAWVTGGSRGIGRATAAALAEQGAAVAITARGAGDLASAASETGATAVPGDCTGPDDVARLALTVSDALAGPPDVVVNAAGAFGLYGLEETPIEAFDAMLAVNLRAPFLVIRTVLPGMLVRGVGHIVSIGSIAGRTAMARNGAYAASKFGLRGLHAVLDAEVRGTGVRATLIEPAATDTALWDAVDAAANPGLPTRAAMMRPRDVADAVLFAVTRRDGIDVRNLLLERA